MKRNVPYFEAVSKKLQDALQEIHDFSEQMRETQVHDIVYFFENSSCIWYATEDPWLSWSYMEEQLYVIRDISKLGGLRRYAFIRAKSVGEALEKFQRGEQ